MTSGWWGVQTPGYIPGTYSTLNMGVQTPGYIPGTCSTLYRGVQTPGYMPGTCSTLYRGVANLIFKIHKAVKEKATVLARYVA